MSQSPQDPHGEPGRAQGRRWLQFSLRTLLIAVALVAGGLLAWRTYVEPYRRQRETVALIERLGGAYETSEAPRWLRRLFGNDFQNVTLVNLADCPEPEKYLEPVGALPALVTLAVGGVQFDDRCARRLHSLAELRELLLDSTSVTAEGLASLQRANPNVAVYESERLALSDLRKLGAVEGAHDGFCPAFVSKMAGQSGVVGGQVFLREPTLSDADLAPLAGLRRAEALVLSGTQVGDAAVLAYCVPNLRGLKLLYLDGTRVGDDGVSQLARLEHLNVLYLDRTAVTDRGLRSLVGLRDLKVLGVSGTQVTPSGIAEVQRALPNCRVFQ